MIRHHKKKNMRKLVLFTIVTTFLGFSASAQYDQGQSDINAGVGFITLGIEGEGSLPLGLSYDYMILDEISVGLGFNYLNSEVKLFGEPLYDVTYINIALRGLYHFDILDPLDTYGGVVLGYTSASYGNFVDDDAENLYSSIDLSAIYYGIVGGIRYRFLNDQFGVFLEAGYAISPITIGLNASF